MRILVTSIGTRGDMEPFLAIGELLKKRGHEVICQFPDQFRNLAEESGFAFEGLGPEFIEMLESDLGKFALGGGGATWKKILAFVKLAKIQKKNNQSMIHVQRETVQRLKPDRIVHNGKVMYPVIHEVENKDTTIFVSPVPYLHYVKNHSHLAFHSNYGTWVNKLTYKLADFGLVKTIMTSMKWLGISSTSKAQIKQALEEHKVIYTISPQLFPRPDYWKPNFQVLGYHERDKTVKWEAQEDLNTFCHQHPDFLFVTFGSMTNPEPAEKTRIILEVLERNQIPAILNTSSGGLVVPESYNKDLFHFVSNIPYEWIFPKAKAVVHHGGSGTTHMALKYKCVSLIIPHVIDQFVWNSLVAENGFGPKGIKIGKLSEEQFEPLVLDLWNNDSYKEKVDQISNAILNEDFGDELAELITN